ncbi:MAG: M48 family metallopeptidase, partial [Syntrophothermus sp.]
HEYDLFTKKTIVKLEDCNLSIISPEGTKSDARAIYQHWLAIKAKQYIPDRTSYLASEYGFRTGRISIKGQKTRWGSCSRLGNLTFNYKLMAYGTDIIDYVIVHELCHLKELNHSKRFWRLVEEILPNYKELRKELRNIK